MVKEQKDMPASNLGMKDHIALTEFCEDLKNLVGDQVRSVILYGSSTRPDYKPGTSHKKILVVVNNRNTDLLKKVAKPYYRAHLMGIDCEFITKESMEASTDVFPIKYQSMKESYVVLRGEDVLQELKINRAHMRLRCEQEFRILSLKLEKHFLEHNGKDLKEMLIHVIGDFIETLRVAVLLQTDHMPKWEKAIEETVSTFKVDVEVLHQIIAVRDKKLKPGRKEFELLYEQFLTFVEKMVNIVDKIK